ncbi:hypothetical protein [Herbidospora mongoliensis]|uniref:hypothetical protein n=1 Tax=Herbidospora mongoliensis TaxID=688067 RepID=UPI0012FB92FB|nr:hypothetical protein [Herbidospora mongoliensis]
MTEQAEMIAIVGAAAAALVAEMAKDSWGSIREIAVRLFGRGGAVEEQRQLERLDSDRNNLETLSEDEIRERWRRRFITLLEDHPEALADLKLLSTYQLERPAASTNQSASHNSGPVIQIGRDNSGDLSAGGR